MQLFVVVYHNPARRANFGIHVTTVRFIFAVIPFQERPKPVPKALAHSWLRKSAAILAQVDWTA